MSDALIHVCNVIPDTKPHLYFCQQIMHNAPIPQLLLLVIQGIQLQELIHYKEIVKDLPYNMREHAINHLQFFKAACKDNDPSEYLDYIISPKQRKNICLCIEKCPLFVDNIKVDWVQTIQSRITNLFVECMKSNIEVKKRSI